MAVELRRTVCNRDCPDACGIVAHVEDGRVLRLTGDRDHPVTRGFLCYRTSHFPARHHGPDRLRRPLRRRGDGFEEISWDEAISVAAGELLRIRAESGPAAILHYRSGGSLGLLKSVVEYFWELFGPVSLKRGDICSGAGEAAQDADFGLGDSNDLFDLIHARHILLWGKNPRVSNVHLIPVLNDARKRGAQIVLIDPVHHGATNLADHVIHPRPGGDFALALGVAARLFETGRTDPAAPTWCDGFEAFRTLAGTRDFAAWAALADVAPSDVERIAAALADGPCAIQVGWGMGRRTNGAGIIRALDALGAVTGNLGIPGGGVSFYFPRRGAFDTGFLANRPPRTLSEPLLGAQILAAADPPVRAVWVTAGNPVAMLPDSATVARALETRELVVVVDSFLTDTARRADLVLPTTTLVEDDDLLGSYGHHWLAASTPVVPPPPEVRSDLEIFQALAAAVDERTGSSIAERMAGTARDWKDRFCRRLAEHEIDAGRLEREAVRNPFSAEVLFADRRFPTPNGRVNLITEAPPEPPEEPGYPLWLFSNSTAKAQSSQWVGAAPAVAPATCHPAAAPGCADGDEVWLESAIARMRARLQLDERQRRDVVIVPKGGHYDAGTCANALIRARLTDAGEGAAYLDCRVRIVRD